MKLFDVYPVFDINLVKGNGCFVYDAKGTEYLDFYGGHAVISIGHTHPHYVKRIEEQLQALSFYSNSVKLDIQQELAQKLGQLSGYDNYNIFLVNSGAEAIENALKLASFHNNKKKTIAFHGAFHGRTSGAVAITDNPKIKAKVNDDSHVIFVELNNEQALRDAFSNKEICAVIVESIQGVNGIYEPNADFFSLIQQLCYEHNAVFIADEIQSGFGRSGKFFAHQFANVQPDIITMAKGMGNGFPIGGILIHPKFEAKYGLLGTTFGGSPLACAASLAVLEVMEQENLIENANKIGQYILEQLQTIPQIKAIRGKGLMLGIEFDFPIKDLRNRLLNEQHIFVGNSNNANTIRLLPSLTIGKNEVDSLIVALKQCLNS
ncbi:MAG: aminotransferase class III-fold pyridoxal phosphate-dependent enzyme [Bacteroidetes bacterium]|nr:aminotransferase class III-fold pyridoxal phosphate-dependent enzyme [Bacteroidota bacterium]